VFVRRSGCGLAAVAVAVLTLATAARASAAQRYASPNGPSTGPCTQAAPCDIVTAINGKGGNMPGSGDEVIVEPGSYYKLGTLSTPLQTELDPTVLETIHGVAGQPEPVIHSSAPSYALFLSSSSPGLTATDLDIEQTAGGGNGLYLNGPTVDQIIVHASGGEACVPDRGTIENSVCWSSATGSPGLYENDGSSTPASVTLRNTDIYATAPGTDAIFIGGSGAGSYTLNATNVIARGGVDATHFDVDVTPVNGTYTASFDHSDYATTHTSATGHITAAGTATNITTGPALVDPAGGDFHESLSSPTIDAGATSALNGSLDFDGEPRSAGGVTDIGADQFLAAPAVTAGSAGAVTTTGATLTGTIEPGNQTTTYTFEYGTTPALGSATAAQALGPGVATQPVFAGLANLQPQTLYYWELVASNSSNSAATPAQSFTTLPAPTTPTPTPPKSTPPIITNVSQSHRTWRRGSRLATLARTGKPPVGTTFSLRLNEPAQVNFAFTQQLAGRRAKRKCVAPTRFNRHHHSCQRTIKRAILSFAGRPGTNRVSFQGRLSRTVKLGPGPYTLVITATNPTGEHSLPKTLRFTIVT
jgi:hypothetical protein